MSGYIPAGTGVQQNPGTSFPELYDSSSSVQTSQPGPQIVTSQPGGVINNPTTPNFTTRLANTFGALNPNIQQTFEKFSPIPQRNVFTRFQQNPHPGSGTSQNAGSNYYRFENFGSQPNSQSNPIGINNPLTANLSVPTQFRSATDSPNYIQLAAEKVASLLNTDAVQFKNSFGSNFFLSTNSKSTTARLPKKFSFQNNRESLRGLSRSRFLKSCIFYVNGSRRPSNTRQSRFLSKHSTAAAPNPNNVSTLVSSRPGIQFEPRGLPTLNSNPEFI